MWFGREGSHGVCRVVNSCCVFQTMTANAYIFMYAFHKQLFIHDHVNSFSSNKKKARKKDNKKAS
jgi:hypothetical protein